MVANLPGSLENLRTWKNHPSFGAPAAFVRLCVTSAPAAVTYYYATAYGVSKAASLLEKSSSSWLMACDGWLVRLACWSFLRCKFCSKNPKNLGERWVKSLKESDFLRWKNLGGSCSMLFISYQ